MSYDFKKNLKDLLIEHKKAKGLLKEQDPAAQQDNFCADPKNDGKVVPTMPGFVCKGDAAIRSEPIVKSSWASTDAIEDSLGGYTQSRTARYVTRKGAGAEFVINTFKTWFGAGRPATKVRPLIDAALRFTKLHPGYTVATLELPSIRACKGKDCKYAGGTRCREPIFVGRCQETTEQVTHRAYRYKIGYPYVCGDAQNTKCHGFALIPCKEGMKQGCRDLEVTKLGTNKWKKHTFKFGPDSADNPWGYLNKKCTKTGWFGTDQRTGRDDSRGRDCDTIKDVIKKIFYVAMRGDKYNPEVQLLWLVRSRGGVEFVPAEESFSTSTSYDNLPVTLTPQFRVKALLNTIRRAIKAKSKK